MQFKTFEHTSIKVIAEVFSKAFEEYAVPMQLSEKNMTRKIKAEGIDLSLSAGSFDNERLVGFILFGVDVVNGVKTMWDGGTAVLPEYRGQRATQQMFKYILPLILKHNVKRVLLEVLETNKTAYSIYQNLGFKKTRKLLVYNGIPIMDSHPKHKVETITSYDADELSNIATWQPAWQQMNNRVKGWGNAITTIAIKKEEQIRAYAHIDISRKRVFQFAVANEYRRSGMGTALFNYMSDLAQPLSIVNIDEHSHDAIAFLDAIGMKYFMSQYEMEYIVSA